MKNYYKNVIRVLTVLTISVVVMPLLALPMRVAALTAPTVVDYNQSTWTDATAYAVPEVTGSVTWQAGDVVVVLGGASNGHGAFNTPTATGLSFSLITSVGVEDPNQVPFQAWSATAASGGSGAVSATRVGAIDFGVQAVGLSVWVYRGAGGIGNSNTLSASSATTISLTRGTDNSAVVVGMGDWNAFNDTAVTGSPSAGSTQRLAINKVNDYTAFEYDWTDQGTAGTTNYGIANFGATPLMSGVVVEIQGSGSSGTARVIRLLGGMRLLGGVRLL